MKSKRTTPLSQRGINTLAQSGKPENKKTPICLMGKGSEMTNTATLKKNANKKFITQKTALGLVDASKNKSGASEMKKKYWNSWHCLRKVYTSNGLKYGKYCKNRSCTVCSGIRKAEIINRYYPVLQQWPDPHFVTLTSKSVSKRGLAKRMKDVFRAFTIITTKHRKKRNNGLPGTLKGIKSLECNFNPKAHTYNVHLHIIVPDKSTADVLKTEWLALWTKNGTWDKVLATPKAQNVKKVWDKEGALVELIKYSSKIFTDPDVMNKTNTLVNKTVYMAALHNIYQAMKNLRIFERFGFNLPKQESKEPIAINQTTDYDLWYYHHKALDWVNRETGEVLTGYTPDYNLVELFEKRTDTELE
ncbi:protein rep [Mucilaginibacter sp. 10I4]|uniref:protein rep n=1 Tax=Mucilaginibacter sp. 10I4 TaxID=3048580 RepID=UPI002B225D5A|nr:protein rep [Mucilaginibacter sp. 10I4]MEB0260502.1 protein rep [Mucilaginibacter sp. 10I4]